MTTGDEEAEGLVDNLFRDVDDQFKDLEREYSQAREELAQASPERPDTPSNALEASNERFELLSQVATLQAEVSRQADELDERDRMLNELGDKVIGFEAEIAQRDGVSTELHAARQETLDERREQARLSALLDARAAERQELADVANRLQNERDHVQELLTTALARFDEAEAQMVQMDDKLRHHQAARDTASHEHDARAHELIESRAEMSKLVDRLDDMAKTAVDADQRAEKAEALAERRSNEAGYLNRRIDAMNEKLDAANSFEDDATNLRRELTMTERRVTELERLLATEQSEAAAATAAVEAIAERTSDYDELVAKNEQLRIERDEAWEAASGHAAAAVAPEPVPEPSAEVASLAQRARELSGRRSSEAASAAQAAEEAAAQASAHAEDTAEVTTEVTAEADVDEIVEPAQDADGELLDLDEDDVGVIEADLAGFEPDGADTDADGEPVAPVVAADELLQAPDEPAAAVEVPVFEFDGTDSDAYALPRVPHAAPEPAVSDAAVMAEAAVSADAVPAVTINDTAEIPAINVGSEGTAGDSGESIPRVTLDHLEAPAVEAPAIEATAAEVPAVEAPAVEAPAAEVPAVEAPAVEAPAAEVPTPEAPALEAPAIAEVPSLGGPATAHRKRTILPADLEPNTPEAVAHLLNQPGVTAIVDARSTCNRTGIRPSELFDRVAMLRDHFDVPVEVVVTPVSTPVGGAPDLPAIGVHYVTGADTVADRIRALCMGFPADQPLVVIAGDDHVRRAAIGEEANVVEPSAMLNLSSDD